jgi:hypothetical protein
MPSAMKPSLELQFGLIQNRPKFCTHYFNSTTRSAQQCNLEDLEICRTSSTVILNCLSPVIMTSEYVKISDDMSNRVFAQLL